MRSIFALSWVFLFCHSEFVRSDSPDPAYGTTRNHDPEAAARGYQALTTRALTPASFPANALDEVWRIWGISKKPENPVAAATKRFGLHPAPYPNDGLPMGLRKGTIALGFGGLALDCMVCHGGSILGQSMIGLGNSSLDLQSLFEELPGAGKTKVKTPYQFSQTRGTNEAGATSVFLLGFRDTQLQVNLAKHDLAFRDDLCEDVPAWWLLHKKATMYATGEGDARSARSIMQFSLSPLHGKKFFETNEATYKDILQYIYSQRAPKYPFPIDQTLAAQGRQIFEKSCSSCHGTYGENPTYPNKIIPASRVGTDSHRLLGFPRQFGEKYNKSWFTEEREGWFADGYRGRYNQGYQAPPLDGVWATAPYLHNGSVPTLAHLLDSHTRPVRFTRSFETREEDFDKEKVGWKVRELLRGEMAADRSPHEQRKIYDTARIGRGNGGHTFGDRLTSAERAALIEYLKTL